MPLYRASGHSLGTHRSRDGGLIGEILDDITPASVKTASVEIVDEPSVHKLAYDMGLTLSRVAGNVYEAPATRDFWAVRHGKLVRLTGAASEVDDGESMMAADRSNPEGSMHHILADLEF